MKGCPAVLAEIRDTLTGFDPVAKYIAQSLRDDCSNVITEGGLIKPKVDAGIMTIEEVIDLVGIPESYVRDVLADSWPHLHSALIRL